MKSIIIVEDEIKLREELKTFLETNGYKIYLITNFENVTQELLKQECDLILLDINLPNINGEYICKEYRKQNNTPIIIVTSRNNEIDELLSINYGADDFITKPYNSQILLARINRVLNRSSNEIIKYRNITLNISKSVLESNNKTVDLSKNELKIFHFLIKNKDRIVSRDEIMDYLWSDSEFVDDNTLTVNINRLRSKLENIGLNDFIVTKRGQGYIINENN